MPAKDSALDGDSDQSGVQSTKCSEGKDVVSDDAVYSKQARRRQNKRNEDTKEFINKQPRSEKRAKALEKLRATRERTKDDRNNTVYVI